MVKTKIKVHIYLFTGPGAERIIQGLGSINEITGRVSSIFPQTWKVPPKNKQIILESQICC